MSKFWIYAACAFSGGLALRIADPIVITVASHFGIDPKLAAMLSTGYALPYALSQPFLGPIGDRFGKERCIQVCSVALAVCLLMSSLSGSFAFLLGTRAAAGVVAGGMIPLVLASIGDQYQMHQRQVMIGRMLFAIIGGQMAGSAVSGLASEWFGWRSVFSLAAGIAVIAAGVACAAMRPVRAPAHGPTQSFVQLYGAVFANPRSGWLYTAVLIEGAVVFGLFPFFGELLVQQQPALGNQAAKTGLVLAAFGVGGLLYAATVQRLVADLGQRRMCHIGALGMSAAFALMPLLELWWLFGLLMLGVGYAYYMLHSSMQTQATELAPAARGSAVGLFASSFFLGQGLGPLLLGPFSHVLGFANSLLAMALGALLVGWIVNRRVIR